MFGDMYKTSAALCSYHLFMYYRQQAMNYRTVDPRKEYGERMLCAMPPTERSSSRHGTGDDGDTLGHKCGATFRCRPSITDPTILGFVYTWISS